MRYAFVSDIHANGAAWKTVLNDIADLKVDKIICLGDVVGYGPDPVDVLESVYQHVHVTLMGNHDAAVAGVFDASCFTPRAQAAVAFQRQMLAPPAMEWLRLLPYTYTENGFRCAHGDFSQPEKFRYIIEAHDALPSWASVPEQLLFVGHTHLPRVYVIGQSGVPHAVLPCDFELENGKRYIINPGSVGYPRAGDCRSCYCIYDDTRRAILFRQLPFDIVGYHAKMQRIGILDDPWVEEKSQEFQLPSVRGPITFAKTRMVPRDPVQESPVSSGHSSISLSPRNHPVWFLTILIALLGIAFLWTPLVFRAGKAAAIPSLAIHVPDGELTSCAVYPLVPLDKNWLSVWPAVMGENGILAGWKYSFENRTLQRFSTGLRNNATTLVVRHTGACRLSVESPLFNLAGTRVSAVRIRGCVRKGTPFTGSVAYRLAAYTTDTDGNLVLYRNESFELHESRKRDTDGEIVVNRKVSLSKSVTYVRFCIDANFDGSLEIEQPYLMAETVRPSK